MNPVLIKVLLVEDDQGDAFWIEELLQAASGSPYQFDLHHCSDLAAARRHLATDKPDAVLLDLGLPDSQGMATLAGILPAAANLPVVVLTGFSDEEFGAAAVKAGAQDYLIKGQLTQDMLVRSLRYALERHRAEEELRSSEHRFRQLADSIPQLVWTCLPEGPCDFLSRKWVEFTGVPEAEQLEYGWLNQVHPEDRARIMEAWEAATATGSDYQMEFRLRRHDGAYYWFLTRAVPWVDAQGRIVKWFGANTDITERKQAEEALRESEERYRSLFENNHAVMLLLDPETGNVVDANPAACAYYGYPRPEFLGRPITEINTFPSEQVFQAMARAAAKDGKYFEFKHRLASGDIRDVEVFSGPVRIRGRELLFSIVHDNTARKQAEEALKRQHAILDGINRVFQETLACETVEQLGKTCLTVAEELTGSKFGFICEVNAAGRFDTIAISDPGWRACKIPLSLTKKMLHDAPMCGTRQRVIETGESFLNNDLPSHPEYVSPPAGHPVITAFLAVPLKHAGQNVGVIGLGNKDGGYLDIDRQTLEALAPAIIEAILHKRAELEVRQARDKLEHRVAERTADLRDTVEQLQWEITERQRAEEARRDSEERLRFLASQLLVAQETERQRLAFELHDDLGQSLMILKMQLRAAERKLPPDLLLDNGLEYSIDYINEIIDNIRRMSHDLRPAVLEDLGLNSAVRYLCEEFSKLHEVEVSLDLDDFQGLAEAGQIAVYRILQESLTNIAKHAHATHIKVSIKAREGQATFRVEDNGTGFDLQEVMAGELAQRGLGLTAMHERVRLLGGQLLLASKPGTGTRITFTIPLTPDDAPA